MFQIDFISAECYPAAKVGGLADVVGSLPKYINQKADHLCRVIMPKYGTKWFKNQKFTSVFKGKLTFEREAHIKSISFSIQKLKSLELGFPLFCVDIPELFDRDGVYAEDNKFFEDEPIRNICFQRAYLEWILEKETPDIIHCHDHHTGLIPYMNSYAPHFNKLKYIPTVFTIHNGQYHGAFEWKYDAYIEPSPEEYKGLLDWSEAINSLSSAVRCAWKITTVSPQYMKELQDKPSFFQDLYRSEAKKSTGILNGIDYEVWNPENDQYLNTHLKSSLSYFKSRTKSELINSFNLNKRFPLVSFIGRFANEKGVDIITESIPDLMEKPVNILILGTGDDKMEEKFREYNLKYPGKFHAELAYNEGLAHKIYAGSDFLMMPSRVEPCGLNQMYAMRYGTIPIVHGVGGLEDTVTHINKSKGTGIKFHGLTSKNFIKSVEEAIKLYANKTAFKKIQLNAFQEDFSWNASTKNYLNLYYELNGTSI